MTIRMVQKPQSIDTVVGTNLHIDILSDLAAALAGLIGVAASANLDPERKNPSIFAPVHGSAFDIMGRGIANPNGAVWAAAEMLAWIGEHASADTIMTAVVKVCKEGQVTKDMGCSLNTKEAASTICREIIAYGDRNRVVL